VLGLGLIILGVIVFFTAGFSDKREKAGCGLAIAGVIVLCFTTSSLWPLVLIAIGEGVLVFIRINSNSYIDF
jgi:uncharacterized membrane protein